MTADDPLAFPADTGQIRRLTILFADLVDSTVLSTLVEPEVYRTLVGRYRAEVVQIVNDYGGYIASTRGDGLLALFGFPDAHEDDVRRAALAGLAIVREVSRIGEMSMRKWAIELAVRVGVHRGPVYLDIDQGDVYGFGANLAARVSSLAAPNTVVTSDTVERLLRNDFELETLSPARVKGVEEPIAHHRVLSERLDPVKGVNPPLVGRDHEHTLIEIAWSKAQSGKLNMPGLLLRGEAGIGKSRLASVAGDLVETSDAKVVELTGSSFHSRAGLHPIRTLLERRCGASRLTDQAERLTLLATEVASRGMDATAVPLLAPVLGIAPEAGYEPAEAEGGKLYQLIGAAVQDYLSSCLGDGPALLVAEDVHWFDPSTIEVLGSLLHAADGHLLVIITARPQSGLPDDWPVEIIDLEPLTDEQADTLICALNPALTADERKIVRRRCDGVPFYIEQVASGLDHPGVPEALYEPLFARLRAGTNAVPVVEAAGIIGRQLDRGLLGAVCTLSQTDIDDVIEELETSRVFEKSGPGMWRFRHELLREVAVELAPPSVRRMLHARVADALVDAGNDVDWGVVAGHFERAERFEEAAKAYQEATTAARRRGALTEARTYLTQALSQLDRAEAGPTRDRTEMSVRMERGWLVAAADGALSSVAAADFEKCLELTETEPRHEEMIETRLDLVESYVRRADFRYALLLLESLRDELADDRPWSRVIVDIWFGIVACLKGDFDSALHDLTVVTERFSGGTKPDIAVYNLTEMVAESFTQLALTHLVRGELASAKAALTQAEQVTKGLGFPEGPFNLAYVRFVEILLLVEIGKLHDGAVLAAEVTAVAERHGLDILYLFGATWQAGIKGLLKTQAEHLDFATLSEDITALTALLADLHAVELNELVIYLDGVLARILIAADRHHLALAGLETSLKLSERTGLNFYRAELLRLRAHANTDPSSRQTDIAAALNLARRQGAGLFMLRAAIDDVRDRGVAAHAGLTEAIGRFTIYTDWPETLQAQEVLRDGKSVVNRLP